MWTEAYNVLVSKATDSWYGGRGIGRARHGKRAKKGRNIQAGEGNGCIKQRDGLDSVNGSQFRSIKRVKSVERTGTKTAGVD